MALVQRLAGAIVVTTEAGGNSAWFLVGDTKQPCDWIAAGFERPMDRDVRAVPWLRLTSIAPPELSGPALRVSLEGEAAARVIAQRFLVERNGSVSERLWTLIFGEDPPHGELLAGWLVEIPEQVWQVVRDVVLKCT